MATLPLLENVIITTGDIDISDVVTRLDLDYISSEWIVNSPREMSCWQLDAESDSLWWNNYVVICDSLAELRELLPMFGSHGRARSCTVVLNSVLGDEHDSVWTSRRMGHHFRRNALQKADFPFVVTITGENWVGVRRGVIAAMSQYPMFTQDLPLGGIRVGITHPDHRKWICGDQYARFMTPALIEPEADDIYAVDVVLGNFPIETSDSDKRVIPIHANDLAAHLPPVDISIISPRGFIPYPGQSIVDLPARLLRGESVFSERSLQDLREFKYVSMPVNVSEFDHRDIAIALSQLTMAGVPVLTSGIGKQVEEFLGRDIVAGILRYNSEDSHVVRESKSIDLRRLAFEKFEPVAALKSVIGSQLHNWPASPSVSVIMATRRPKNLAFALQQIARQSWSNLELVLVMHGFTSKTGNVRELIDAFPGRIIECEVDAAVVFGDALNRGVAMASGDLITKMDDDDWYGNNHIKDLVYARCYSGAMLVGAQVEFVYLEGIDVTTRRPPAGDRFSDHVAGGTMMISKENLRDIGGWRPVHRAVDRCLLQAVEAVGGSTYRTHGQNYMMQRHSEAVDHGGHTWNPGDSIFLQNISEQWDGFVPPPQITVQAIQPADRRETKFRSYFSGKNFD